jgi:hypothetical protein
MPDNSFKLSKYLTDTQLSYREFAKFAYSQPDRDKYIISRNDYKKGDDIKYTFYDRIDFSRTHQDSDYIRNLTLYCKVFICEYCRLSVLPQLPFCEILFCSANVNLKTFPDMPFLKVINCFDTGIKDFSNLNKDCKIVKGQFLLYFRVPEKGDYIRES